MTHVLRCTGYELVKRDIVRAQGCFLYDAQGRRYLDLEAGVWCAALGHNHPRVNQVICEQLERVAHLGYRYTTHVVEGAAAAVLSTLARPECRTLGTRDAATTTGRDSADSDRGRGTPCTRMPVPRSDDAPGPRSAFSEGKCVFLSSGSEAVEFGVQVARRLIGQPLLLTLSDAYLAAYGSAGTKDPSEWYSFDWTSCAACPHAEWCDPGCPHLREIPWQRIGGWVFEPGSSSGLVRFPPLGLVLTLARLTQEQGGLLVVDEVTTGLGRTGAWYGFQHYGLDPDIVALGKGLGNGYPVSAVAMRGEVTEQLEESGEFHYAQSHQNDPLGCAVAKEVITVLRQERLVERSAEVGSAFLNELRHLVSRHDVVREARGRGLMIAVQFAPDERALVKPLYHELVERGFFVGCKPLANLLRFYPPLTVAKEDIGRLSRNLDHVLEALD
jgi:acetylornithine aminotransferase